MDGADNAASAAVAPTGLRPVALAKGGRWEIPRPLAWAVARRLPRPNRTSIRRT